MNHEMPESPISADAELAIQLNETLKTYVEAGFTRPEAFTLMRDAHQSQLSFALWAAQVEHMRSIQGGD